MRQPTESLMGTRPTAVAGTWYPEAPRCLRDTLDRHLASAELSVYGETVGLIAPHAGLAYSGPVAAHAYKAISQGCYDVVVLVGPSHHVGFEGVAMADHAEFDTPLGPLRVAANVVEALSGAPCIRRHPSAHGQEHSLEMQLPFLRHLLPDTPIVPLIIGCQDRGTILALADTLADTLGGCTPLLVASTDLSHFFDAKEASALADIVIGYVTRFDAEGLLVEYERHPKHDRGRYVACGGGAAVAVMKASAALGARDGRVLSYADSGDVSGDKTSVVGYLAAAFGRFVSEA